MSLRARLTLVAAGVVAVVVGIAAGTTYFVMRHELYSQVDSSLRDDARAVDPNNLETPGGFPANLVEIFKSDGDPVGNNTISVPFNSSMRAVAAGRRGGYFQDATVPDSRRGGTTMGREFVQPIYADPGGQVVGVAVVVRYLDETDRALDRLRLILLLVALGGVLLAAVAGRIVSNATLAPVRRLTAAAEHIAETGEPSERVPEGGRDELGRLASSFNTMLASLEESLDAQRRFVGDASHELRTPLTSIQTNIDVLRGDIELGPQQRRQLLDDLHRESQEMRGLIASLLELARAGGAQQEKAQFQLDEIVEDVLQRAQSRFPAVTWKAYRIEPTVVDGYRDRMERAVWNLFENAGKWSGDGGSVEVSLTAGELRVRDHGPGIDEEDQPLVFDRFYRSAASRSMPGAGLGLAIVREVAEAHGGTVAAENATGGGALFRLSLNGAARPGSLA
jgi:two-component system sensor histidine kinase MprB